MCDGYIKLHRKITDWKWFKNQNTLQLFIYLLVSANWKDGEFETIKVPRGSLITGRKALAEKLELSERSVRTALEHLKSTNEITIKSTNKFSIITIVNYEKYQTEGMIGDQQIDQQFSQQPTNNRPTTDQQVTTIEEIKKERRKESNIYKPPSVFFDNKDLDSAFKDFLEMRKSIKKPIKTEKAMNLALNNVKKILDDKGIDYTIKCIDTAIYKQWLSVYEIKDTTTKFNNFEERRYDFKSLEEEWT